MAVVARALSDRRSDERRAHGCHSALLKGEVRDLTAWLDGPGIHRFFNGEHGSKRAFRRFKPPGWLRPFSRKDGCTGQAAVGKKFGHAAFGGLPAAPNAPSSTASSNDPPQKQPLMAPLPPGMEFEKPPGKRSRARRKEDQRQQSAIRAALEMRAGQSGASASNVEALRESSDLNPLRRAQSDRIAAALDAAAQAA